jgi:NAD(P)-dependent dehydrogenase (short-subunit alcohol dehydrogenase family)
MLNSDNFIETGAVIVTGGASGIGQQVAVDMAARGRSVFILDVQQNKIDEMVSACRADGHSNIDGVAVDVSDPVGVKAAIERAQSEFGPISLLVACAGIARGEKLDEITEQNWRNILRVNLGGVMNAASVVSDMMIANGAGGRIVVIGSRGILGDEGYMHYVISKAATVGYARALALKLARDRITVNSVSPAFVETPMTMSVRGPEVTKLVASLTPLKRNALPADIAAAISYFGSSAASFVTGQNMFVCGGRSLVASMSGSGR